MAKATYQVTTTLAPDPGIPVDVDTFQVDAASRGSAIRAAVSRLTNRKGSIGSAVTIKVVRIG